MIVAVVQKGNTVKVWNEKGVLLHQIACPGTLVGFTPTTWTMKKGNMLYVYNERATIISMHST
ncbi:MAG: hypothetical protein ACP5LR_08510 [Athalassotoga sp.]|uniref:hypothetical protein n=1 Tax=Athalassotoga sp. TaxID=2022597 RepID=UPI003D060B99